MPGYDALHYDPPAPVAQVMLRIAGGASVSDVLLLLDTGADTTLLPRSAIARLGITPDPALQYELIGFDGSRSRTQAVDLDMIFLQKTFRGRYLIIDDERGILGRDVLASVSLLFNGPAQEWQQHFASS
ncbi:MAG TPA: retropepsin-like aspartic protease [Tepidisphaeraceae bacterium]|nr:retropepsin-like aspartic protease [Tepidisphaeraceae bacterium]